MKRRNFLKALAVTSLAPVAMVKAKEAVPMTATEVLERQDAYWKSIATESDDNTSVIFVGWGDEGHIKLVEECAELEDAEKNANELMLEHNRNMMLYGTSAYTVDEDGIIDSVIHPSQLVDFDGQLIPRRLAGSNKKFKVETL